MRIITDAIPLAIGTSPPIGTLTAFPIKRLNPLPDEDNNIVDVSCQSQNSKGEGHQYEKGRTGYRVTTKKVGKDGRYNEYIVKYWARKS